MSSTTSGSSETTDVRTPSPDDNDQTIDLVTSWIEQVHIADMSTTGSTRGRENDSSGPKVNKPQEFSGNWRQFSAFKVQCLIAFKMHPTQFDTADKKVMFITSYLRGPAYDWVQPHIEDYLTHSTAANRRATTTEVLESATTLMTALEQTFGQGNDRLEAERDLRQCRQKGSAAKYKAEFQSLALKTGWNDTALADAFYMGLKEGVKDEIVRQGRPDTQTEMFDLAMTIDTRLWERQQERGGKHVVRTANTGARREAPKWRNDYYGPQPMQLDATQGYPKKRGPGKVSQGPRQQQGNGPRKPFDKSQLECHNCGKKGHFARECNARKQRHELPKPEQIRATKEATSKQKVAATRVPDHAELTWTACYDDDCHVHMSDKEGSGWYPSDRTKAQSVCVLRGTPQNALVPRESSPEPEESSDEDYEVVEASSSEIEEEVIERWVMPPNDAGMNILRLLRTQWTQVCPWIDDIQYVDQHYFDQLAESMRRQMRLLPVTSQPHSHERIVQEIVPFGSEFTPKGGYFTPEGINVPRTLRLQVANLRLEYGKNALEQRGRTRVMPLNPTNVTHQSMSKDETFRDQIIPGPDESCFEEPVLKRRVQPSQERKGRPDAPYGPPLPRTLRYEQAKNEQVRRK